MMYYTHLLFAALIALFLFPFNISPYIAFPLILVGSIFPDIDQPRSYINQRLNTNVFSKLSKHRGFFHSIWCIALVYVVFMYFFKQYLPYASLFLVGYFSHLLADGMTLQGINFLHPFSRLHLSGFIRTNSATEKFLALILLCALVFVLVF